MDNEVQNPVPTPSSGNKKPLVIVLVILVVVAAGIVWYSQSRTQPQTQQPPASGQTADQLPQIKKTEVPTNKLPDGFPADIPLEAGASITQNYNAEGTGLVQATRVWTTQQTLDASFLVYTKFFNNAKNGWKVLTTLNQPQLKSISVSKGDVQVIVTINQNSITQEKTVSISATWPAPGK